MSFQMVMMRILWLCTQAVKTSLPRHWVWTRCRLCYSGAPSLTAVSGCTDRQCSSSVKSSHNSFSPATCLYSMNCRVITSWTPSAPTLSRWAEPAVNLCNIQKRSSKRCIVFPSMLWHCWLGVRKGIRAYKKLGVGGDDLTVVCKTYSSSCHHHPHNP